jgi:hypothetical protein
MTVNTTTGAMNEAEGASFDNSDVYENADASQSFDNWDEAADDQPGATTFDDEEEDSEESEDDDGEEKLGSEELKLLNDSDGKGPKKEKKEEEESEEEESEEASEESEEEEKSIEKAPDAQGKKLRIKIGDEHFSLDSSAKMKVKIDGQNEEVTIQDLINNYSGKQAWDKKFTEIGNDKKSLVQEKQMVERQKGEIKDLLGPVISTIKDPLKNPMDAIIHLAEKLDTTGDLAYAIEKRMLEANLDTLVELSAMSDDQQRAYFLEKQNARLLKSSERRIQSEQETAKSNQLRGHVDQLREAYKVSVEQYSEAFEELKRLPNAANVTHEHVVDWASLKPLVPQVEDILKPFVDEINDSDYSGIVTSLSRSLRDGKLSKQEIQKMVKEEFGVPAEVKKLNTKLNIGKKKVSKEPEVKTGVLESFEDLVD